MRKIRTHWNEKKVGSRSDGERIKCNRQRKNSFVRRSDSQMQMRKLAASFKDRRDMGKEFLVTLSNVHKDVHTR